jgi:hypothetical protein
MTGIRVAEFRRGSHSCDRQPMMIVPMAIAAHASIFTGDRVARGRLDFGYHALTSLRVGSIIDAHRKAVLGRKLRGRCADPPAPSSDHQCICHG